MFDLFFWKSERLPLPYKRELHCHLIPGVDDGSTSMDFSIKALKFLESHGVEKVIFTPHYTYPRFINFPENIQPIFDDVKDTVKKKNIDIECENFSFEYRAEKTFEKMVLEGGAPGTPECKIRPLRGPWVLIENGWHECSPCFENVIDSLKEKGFKVIIAHPERYRYYGETPAESYNRLLSKGAYFQCNLLSLSGYYGRLEKEVSMWMLKKGFIHFLGSDIHNSSYTEHLNQFLKSRDYSDIYDQLSDNVMNDIMGK